MATNEHESNISAWDAMMSNVAGLPEVERLRAENAAMRAIVEAVADARIVLTPTMVKEADEQMVEGPMLEHLEWSGDTEASVRVWRQARTFVAQHPAQEAD